MLSLAYIYKVPSKALSSLSELNLYKPLPRRYFCKQDKKQLERQKLIGTMFSFLMTNERTNKLQPLGSKPKGLQLGVHLILLHCLPARENIGVNRPYYGFNRFFFMGLFLKGVFQFSKTYRDFRYFSGLGYLRLFYKMSKAIEFQWLFGIFTEILICYI